MFMREIKLFFLIACTLLSVLLIAGCSQTQPDKQTQGSAQANDKATEPLNSDIAGIDGFKHDIDPQGFSQVSKDLEVVYNF